VFRHKKSRIDKLLDRAEKLALNVLPKNPGSPPPSLSLPEYIPHQIWAETGLLLEEIRQYRAGNTDYERIFRIGFMFGSLTVLLELDDPSKLLAERVHAQMAKLHALRQWDSEARKMLYSKACEEAERRWADGAQAFHNEMAKKLCELPEFKALGRKELQAALKPIARRYGMLLGVRKMRK